MSARRGKGRAEESRQHRQVQIIKPYLFVYLLFFQDVWDKCLYKCAICEEEYKDRRVVNNHVKNKHEMDFKAYLEQFGDPEVSCPKV